MRWAILRRALQNSPDVRTSTTAVWTASEAISPRPTCRTALFFALRQWSKKYLALFLCTMSTSVPPTTSAIMIMTYACMMVGLMEPDSAANGLLATIVVISDTAQVQPDAPLTCSFTLKHDGGDPPHG